MNTPYERLGVFEIDDVLPYISTEKPFREYLGNTILMYNLKYQTFKKSLECANCGIKGSFFALERDQSNTATWHFNLYAICDGVEILMTKDHIMPVSKGGTDHEYNLQTMCYNCNQEKSNIIPDIHLYNTYNQIFNPPIIINQSAH